MSDVAKRIKPGWFHGAAIDLSARFSRLLWLFLLVLTAGLIFSQFGIIPCGGPSVGEVNFAVFLVPAALATVMLGVVPGVGLAIIAGVLISIRAQWAPTCMFDFNMADPFLSVSAVFLGALLLAICATFGARRWPADLSRGVSVARRVGPAHIVSIVIGCFAFSFAFSYMSRGLIYLLVSPGGAEYGYSAMIQELLDSLAGPTVLVEAIANGIALSAICYVSVAADAGRRSGSWKISLNASFTRWLAFSMLVVFVLASSVSFCSETVHETADADEQIMAELDYLQQQAEARLEANASVTPVAESYATKFGGTVAIIRNREIVSSNDPEYVGKPATKMLSSEGLDNYDFLLNMVADHMLIGTDEETKEFYAIRALVGEHYTFIAAAPTSKMFKGRTATLTYNAAFFLAIQAIVFLVVYILLRKVVIGPIHRTNETLGRITGGELQQRVDEREVTEFDELSNGINSTVVALKDMMDEVEERNTQDLVAAKAIQESALPREFPPFPDVDRFDIYASMKTAKAVGGDFYDFFLLEGDKLAFLIADVSGKGIPAALFMMTAKTQLRTYLESGLPVDEAVNAANHQLCIGNDAGMFVTCWVGVLDYQTGLLEFVNAGHNPPLRHSESWEWMREVSGMPLGLFDGIPYDKHACPLAAGDTLYLYTDGVTEAMDVDGNLFSEERLIETLGLYTGMNARSVSVGIRRAITDFTKDAEQSDDITMLALHDGVPPETRASMTLSADVNQLVHVYNFIHEELHRRGAPRSVYNPLDIAAEELFVNVCHYAYPDDPPEALGEVRIEFEYEANPPSLTVTIIDDGVPYNPLAKPDAVTPDDIADVPIGGLGILMAKNSVDDMTYERKDGSNILTFRKGW